jgi:transcriptional regulator with XRE-family HTH domain
MKHTRLGIFLRKLRVDLGETQKTMAKKLHISPVTLSAIELGRLKVREDLIKQLATVYDMTAARRSELFEAAQASKNLDMKFHVCDIFNILIDMAQTVIETPAKTDEKRAYQQGYMDALASLKNKLMNGE